MDVVDTFIFKDGTTVFVGPIDTTLKFIGPCDCDVVSNGESKLSFRIDGEMIPSPSKAVDRPPHRAVSTREPIDLHALGLGRGGFKIRSKT